MLCCEVMYSQQRLYVAILLLRCSRRGINPLLRERYFDAFVAGLCIRSSDFMSRCSCRGINPLLRERRFDALAVGLCISSSDFTSRCSCCRISPGATKTCGNHTAISFTLLNLYTLLINKHYIATFCYKFDFIHCLFSVLKVSYFQLITGGWNYRFSVIN